MDWPVVLTIFALGFGLGSIVVGAALGAWVRVERNHAYSDGVNDGRMIERYQWRRTDGE